MALVDGAGNGTLSELVSGAPVHRGLQLYSSPRTTLNASRMAQMTACHGAFKVQFPSAEMSRTLVPLSMRSVPEYEPISLTMRPLYRPSDR